MWEIAFFRDNLERALQRVERNRGAAGVDGMLVTELRGWLNGNWQRVLGELEAGSYRPSSVRRVTIPKPGGGQRELGVPTVLDRLIQQAIAQALVPIFDPEFSEHSYGFRPGRGAHQAVTAARAFVETGYDWVVDVDLERFFDRVQHDALMARVARKVADKRVLRLIRRYVETGVMVDGVKQPTEEGTPQGSPISPLLSNIMLDDLDRELERRGHRFVRYADDLRIHVKSERAGQRVLDKVTGFIEKRLKLKVNKDKSWVRHAAQAVVLGFGFLFTKEGRIQIRVSDQARQRLRQRLRLLTGRERRVPMSDIIRAVNRFIAGWTAYFGLAETEWFFRDHDGWLRRRLRQVRWAEWKAPATRRRKLLALGLTPRLAIPLGGTRGSWRAALALNPAMPDAYWQKLGLIGLADRWTRLRGS
ncbi:MAG: group II intron reverse transcriptase/maturase [Candidatus Dormibacteraeota bacterium]|nr:group II intron reverse transcriptase/maturase [Candidatus Dormibacteraeota bacterium]